MLVATLCTVETAACPQLAEAIPAEGSGLTLPLDLRAIASKCNGSYYAPKRFAAVQLAFSCPRSRVLIFHTGRLVGTGTESAMAARLAIARAQQQLAIKAGVHLAVRNFQIINSVGAVSLNATLDCESFATANRDTSHYDRASFVGLAFRPSNEAICCEVYSTGRANLPGSVVERQLHDSFSRILPELLKHSTASRLLVHFPDYEVPNKEVMGEWRDAANDHAKPGINHDDDEDPPDPDDDEIDDATLGALGL